MPLKTIQGIGGNVALPSGFNAKLRDFTFNFNLETADVTGFIDVGWRVFEPVIQSFDGSASGTLQFDAATTAPVPAGMMGSTPNPALAKGTIVLTFATGCTWTFTGTISGFSGSRAVDGKGEVTFNFQHSGGGITQVWDETP